jgi:phenylalanyl-tRNA synthetase beta chain
MSSAKTGLFGAGNGAGNASVRLLNPISADLDEMRPSILPNLVDAAQRNADRGYPDLALCEVGPQYAGAAPEQQAMVAAGLRAGDAAPRHWSRPQKKVDAFMAKADAVAAIAAADGPVANLQVTADAPAWYHPGRSGVLRLGTKAVAFFGELHPAVLKAMKADGPMVGFEVFLEALPPPKAKQGRARPAVDAPSFQPVNRDFAFVVKDDVAAEKLLRAARTAEKELVADVQVFDVYAGKGVPDGHKSLALAVTLQPRQRTLTDAEIEAVGQKIVAAVAKATGATLRS